MKTTQKFTSSEAAFQAVRSIVKSLPHTITQLPTGYGELLFEATSPIDSGYIVVFGSVYMDHDEKNNKIWTLTKHQGM